MAMSYYLNSMLFAMPGYFNSNAGYDAKSL